MAHVGSSIEAKLIRGYIQKDFRHLKGWHRAVMEMQAKACYLTMERQTSGWVDLYAWRQSPRGPFPINIPPMEISMMSHWMARSDLQPV